MSLTRLERELRAAGFYLARLRGSHRHYRDAAGHRLTLAHHPGRAIDQGQLAAIRRDLRRLSVQSVQSVKEDAA